MRVGFDWAF